MCNCLFSSCPGLTLRQAPTPPRATAALHLQLFLLSRCSSPALRVRGCSTAALRAMAMCRDTRDGGRAPLQDTASPLPPAKLEVPSASLTCRPTLEPCPDSAAGWIHKHLQAGLSQCRSIHQPQRILFQLNFAESRYTDPPEGSRALALCSTVVGRHTAVRCWCLYCLWSD